MHGAIAEDARADESMDGRGRAKQDARAESTARGCGQITVGSTDPVRNAGYDLDLVADEICALTFAPR
jgi:hypothetical protein